MNGMCCFPAVGLLLVRSRPVGRSAVTPACADAEAVTATNKNGVLTTIPRNTPAQSPAKPLGQPGNKSSSTRASAPAREPPPFWRGLFVSRDSLLCRSLGMQKTPVRETDRGFPHIVTVGGTPLPHARLRVVSLHHEVFPSR